MKLPKFKKWEIIKICWTDSCSQDAWMPENVDLDEKYMKCETVGYFLAETKHSIAVAQSYTPPRDKKSIAAVMQIPKVAINKYQRLK